MWKVKRRSALQYCSIGSIGSPTRGVRAGGEPAPQRLVHGPGAAAAQVGAREVAHADAHVGGVAAGRPRPRAAPG